MATNAETILGNKPLAAAHRDVQRAATGDYWPRLMMMRLADDVYGPDIRSAIERDGRYHTYVDCNGALCVTVAGSQA